MLREEENELRIGFRIGFHTMEATKETVDNLIMNASKTIEDLFAKVNADNKLLNHCDDQVTAVLMLMLELRRDIRFVLIDLLTSLRACLNSASTFEKCYHIKNLEGIRVEGYQLLCGYGKEKEDAIWTRIGVELHRCQEKAKEDRIGKAYEGLVLVYDQITEAFNNIAASDEERTSRNLTYHYDDELLLVYKQLTKVRETGEDTPMKLVIPWMDALLMIVMLCETIERVEDAQGNKLPDGSLYGDFRVDVMALHLYKTMAETFAKADRLLESLELPLKEIDRIDWAAMEKQKLLKLNELLLDRTQVVETPKVLSDLKYLLNIDILIRIIFADIAAIMKAFLKADTDIEHALNLRRLVISKVSALGHLVGYNDVEKQNALWTTIEVAIPTGDILLRMESQAIRQDLEALIDEKDMVRRALYVHLMDRYSHESNVPAIIANLEGVDLMVEINSITNLIKVLGRIKKFLTPLFKAIEKEEDRRTKETDAEFRAFIKKFRELTNMPNVTADLKKLINKSVDQMEKMMESFKKL